MTTQRRTLSGPVYSPSSGAIGRDGHHGNGHAPQHERLGVLTAATVLVVDDEPGVATLVRLTLEDEGFRVTWAPDGRAALELIAEREPDILVLDLQMPQMDGATLYRQLREQQVRIPTLILSAYGARRAQRELGAEDALDKPFDVDELAARVRRLLAVRSA